MGKQDNSFLIRDVLWHKYTCRPSVFVIIPLLVYRLLKQVRVYCLLICMHSPH
jgi:hypothetical protein